MNTDALKTALGRVIRGKEGVLELLVTALVAGGHLLLEDLPGTGKTTLARALAHLVRADAGPLIFRRIQFTPDLLPYDITGVDIYDPARRHFRFSPGPVFTHILLADEINRATPKVQSALLEVMNEQQVTVGGTTRRLDELFLVIGTENPLTMEGTYPLPLAQLDRFMMRLPLGYPDEEAELSILRDDPGRRVMPVLRPVISREEILQLRAEAREVFVHEDMLRSVAAIARATRSDNRLQYGASPRAALHLLDAMRALALIRRRDYVSDSELNDLLVPVLAHRLRTATVEGDAVPIVREIGRNAIRHLHERRGGANGPALESRVLESTAESSGDGGP